MLCRRSKSENKRRICLVFFVVSPFHSLEPKSTPALDCFLFIGGHHVYFPLNLDEDYMLQGMPINQIKRKEKGGFLIILLLLFRQKEREKGCLLSVCTECEAQQKTSLRNEGLWENQRGTVRVSLKPGPCHGLVMMGSMSGRVEGISSDMKTAIYCSC